MVSFIYLALGGLPIVHPGGSSAQPESWQIINIVGIPPLVALLVSAGIDDLVRWLRSRGAGGKDQWKSV